MTGGATMPAFSDKRLIDAAGAVVADQPEQRPLLVVAVASRLEGRYRRGGENADDYARRARQWTAP
jgi:hypothetical protein